MTKKKEKKTKIKESDIPKKKAVYPLRCGTEVYAFIWNEHTMIYGVITLSYSVSQLNVAGAEHFYDIETKSGKTFEGVSENDVFLTDDLVGEFLWDEIQKYNTVEE